MGIGSFCSKKLFFEQIVLSYVTSSVFRSAILDTNYMQPIDNQEEQIIKLLWNQDKEAISLIYDRYSDSMFGIVCKILPSKEHAEDILQEAFVKIWKNGCRYDPSKGSLFTWILNITRNLAIDKLRSMRSKGKSKIFPITVTHQNIPEKQQLDPNHIGLRQIVDKLDKKYKEVIDLVYFQGFSQTEVEKHLNIPLGTVKSRIRIGLRELRKAFDDNRITIIWIFYILNFGVY